MAKLYKLLEATYKSELQALKTKTKTHALKMCGNTLIPELTMATTNGEAAAEVLLVLASNKSGSSYPTHIPNSKILIK